MYDQGIADLSRFKTSPAPGLAVAPGPRDGCMHGGQVVAQTGCEASHLARCTSTGAGDDGQQNLTGFGVIRWRGVVAGLAAMIRVDAVWLSIEPMNLRAGNDTALAIDRWKTKFGGKLSGEISCSAGYMATNDARKRRQALAVAHRLTPVWVWCRRKESNPRPSHYE